MGKSIIVRYTGGGGNEPQGRQGFLSKLPFSKSKFSVSNVNKYYVGVKPQPTLSCVGRIEKRLIKNSLCHPELVSGSSHRQKCSAICTQKSNVGQVCPTDFDFNTISYASWKATRHVRGDLVPAFTLAEVLITLGIIGVVAAMTLPTLMSKYRENVTMSKLKKAYTTLAQAQLMSISENGDVDGWDWVEAGQESNNAIVLAWFNKYFGKYLNKAEVIDKKKLDPATQELVDDGILVRLADGSIVKFYNFAGGALHINLYTNEKTFLDGTAEHGKDAFMFAFNNSTSKRLNTYGFNVKDEQKLKYDSSFGCYGNPSIGRVYCARILQIHGWTVPDDYPWKF